MKYGEIKTDPGAAINGHTSKIGANQSKTISPSANGQSKSKEKVTAKAS